MSITKTITLYEFDELSEEAKEKARQWWRQYEAEEFGSLHDLHESAETAAKLLGITFRTNDIPLMSGKTRSEPRIYWQLDGQGYGASFEGSYAYVKGSVKAVKSEFPEDVELQRIANELASLQKRYVYGLHASIERHGREVHKYSMDLEAYTRDGWEVSSDDTGSALLELMRDFADWIYKGIQAEWDYRMSDESVDDNIRSNEYTFTAAGKRES